MTEKQFLQDESEKLAALSLAPDTVFLFDIDVVELSLFNRNYGRNRGNEFLNELEAFISALPWVSACAHVESGRFIFDVISDSPLTGHDIADYWKDHIGEFIIRRQKQYPDFSIHISCGICPIASDDTLFDAIENATLARKASRNNKAYVPVVYTSELLEQLSLLHKKEVTIREALIEDRFTYYLQPIVELRSGRIIASEALARIVSDAGKLECPASFLPVMENNGSIIELDYLIMRKVCKDLKERIKKGKPVVCTSINLFRAHLDDETTADTLLSIASEYDISPTLLNFELTETLPMDEFSKARGLICRLRERGFRVSIDDYGSGYTGITIWQDLDFDVLKMDRRFMSDDNAVKRRNTVLIPNTIDLAKKMDISVVCEGVERIDQCNALKKWGCDTAQGYYFSRPVSVENFYERYEACDGTFSINIM